jgi:hypothetical protein
MADPANPYCDIDPLISAWVKNVGSFLFTEFGGKPVRCFHLPGLPPFECFQVTIEPPGDGLVKVFARAIDTNDDIEDDLELSWHGRIAELDAMIAAAVTAIEGWKGRKIRPVLSKGTRFSPDGTPLTLGQNH